MRPWGELALGLALAVTLAGCGARVAPGEPLAADSPAGVATDADPATDAAADGGTSPGDGETGGGTEGSPAGAGTDAAGEPYERPSRPPHNTVVRITVSSECVRVGDVLVVTITGPPKAGLGAVIGFSDAQAHGATTLGETDAAGKYIWRVPIEPTVPPGEATALASVSGPNGSQSGGGSADKKFRVGDLTGC